MHRNNSAVLWSPVVKRGEVFLIHYLCLIVCSWCSTQCIWMFPDGCRLNTDLLLHQCVCTQICSDHGIYMIHLSMAHLRCISRESKDQAPTWSGHWKLHQHDRNWRSYWSLVSLLLIWQMGVSPQDVRRSVSEKGQDANVVIHDPMSAAVLAALPKQPRFFFCQYLTYCVNRSWVENVIIRLLSNAKQIWSIHQALAKQSKAHIV